jgi:hypothetical protein
VDGEIRVAHNLAEKRQERKCGKRRGEERRTRATGIVGKNWRNSRNTGSSEQRRRRVTFVLDFR